MTATASTTPKPAPVIVWGYTKDPDEGYHSRCVSREDALAEATRALGLKPGDTIWICQGKDPEPTIDGDWAMERLSESVEEHLPMGWDDWPALSHAQREELGRVLTEAALGFLERHGIKPDWYEVIEEEKLTVPAAVTP